MSKGFAILDMFRLRPRNIRIRLLRDLGLVVVLTSGAILAVSLYNARVAHRRLAQTQIEQAAALAAQEFERRLDPVDQGVQMAWEWGKMGVIDATNDVRMMEELTPVLRPLVKVTAAVVANANGHEVYLEAQRGADGELEGWITRTRDPNKEGDSYLQTSWGPNGRKLGQSWVELPGYVPEQRPWFKGAVSNESEDTIFRSRPYRLYAHDDYGVSQALNWTNDAGVENVVAFDMLLSGLFEMVNEIDVSDGGVAFLCNSSGEVFLPPAAEEGALTPPPMFVSPTEASNPLVASAAAAWGPIEDAGPVRFKSSQGSGWAGFSLLDPLSGLWIGVAVPDTDLLGARPEGLTDLLVVVGLVLALGFLLAIRIVRKYGHQLRDAPRQLVAPGSFANDVRALIDTGEGPTLEFKSTVRRNLKTDKNGKEIELAWLKGAVAFMNTDGGAVLIGVGDGGELLGIEPDEFENDDRCHLHLKNLLNQHIGAEFSRFIAFQVQPIEGKTVVAVQCERSPKPVFLRWNNKETFYIRSGPSTIELSARQVLEYVQGRG